jgi:uncharacterized membrane protein
MSLPKAEHFPDDPDLMPPARRRRARRLLAPLDADERTVVLEQLRHRTSATFDFYLFSLFSALIFGLGLLLNAPALLVLGTVFAPLLVPVVGLSFGTVIGSIKFFGRSLVALTIASLLVFIMGLVIGVLGRALMPLPLSLAYVQAELSLINFLVLTVGAVFTTATMAHPERSPAAPNIALVYTLYLPLVVAGFGLGSGAPHLFPDGLVVFAIHLAWGVLLGAIILAIVGFRPMTFIGYTMGAVVTLMSIALMFGVGAYSTTLGWFGTPLAVATYTPTATSTLTPVPPSPTSTLTPVPPTLTPTVTLTPTLSPTPTQTFTPSPVPVYARIAPPEGGVLRSAPGFDAAIINPGMMQGVLVKLLEESQEVNGFTWVKVLVVEDGREGWVLQSLLSIATPEPNW